MTSKKKLRELSLQEYTKRLASREPIPGGGSAAALVASVGTALIAMVGQYALKRPQGKKVATQIRRIIREANRLRQRFLVLVDLDAQVYLKVVQTKNASVSKKASALKKAREIPLEVCRLCYEATGLTPPLVKYGSRYLLSDVEVAVELLSAAFNAAMANVKVNQL